MSARATRCGSASLRRTSGRRPAIAPTTSPIGSRPTGRCLPVTPSFTLGCGRVMESTHAQMWNSLTRLAALPDDARVYSGHDYVIANGKFALAADPDNAALRARMAEAEKAEAEGRFLIPSTLREEKATNPFLRAGEPALARSVKMEGAEPVAVFQALREWKNRF